MAQDIIYFQFPLTVSLFTTKKKYQPKLEEKTNLASLIHRDKIRNKLSISFLKFSSLFKSTISNSQRSIFNPEILTNEETSLR